MLGANEIYFEDAATRRTSIVPAPIASCKNPRSASLLLAAACQSPEAVICALRSSLKMPRALLTHSAERLRIIASDFAIHSPKSSHHRLVWEAGRPTYGNSSRSLKALLLSGYCPTLSACPARFIMHEAPANSSLVAISCAVCSCIAIAEMRC